ncbi:MAG TPA: class I SAM-dependent methyltransferase family protein, partial [Methanotrichaceae archaeon]|nr:class I SAM-dependent methyltransferase family protein [Methanotrichaceae archaeon]
MSLKDDLRGIIPDEKLAMMPGHFNIVGEIAIVSLPPSLDDYKDDVARAITSRHKYLKTVLNKASKVQGCGRVARFEILAGNSTIATHTEFGHIYRLDVAQVFFNTRLSFERRRVALKSKPGEMVLMPFCGVGPFAVPVAAAGATVVAIEKSSEACRWLAENARLNGVEDRIFIINGDALDA